MNGKAIQVYNYEEQFTLGCPVMSLNVVVRDFAKPRGGAKYSSYFLSVRNDRVMIMVTGQISSG